MSFRTTLGIADRDLYEGDDESRRRAREATYRQTRLNLARGHATWRELDADVIDAVAGRYVTDTSTGFLYHPAKLYRVFPSGAAQLVNDAEADAFYVVDDELYFLRRPKNGPTTVAELEERRSRPKPEPRRRLRSA